MSSIKYQAFSSSHRVRAILYFAVWTMIILFMYWFPFNFIPDKQMIREKLHHLSLIPFSNYNSNSLYDFLIQILGIVVFFVPSGVMLSRIIKGGRAFSANVNWVVIALWFSAVCAVCGVVELGQFFLPEGIPDATDVLVECAGVWMGFFLSKQLFYEPAMHSRG